MTTITIENNDKYILIKSEGHAGYEKAGKDIVCSSISTAMYETFFALDEFECKPSREIKEAYFLLTCDNNAVSRKIVKCFKRCMTDLEEQYGKYVRVIVNE